MWAVSAAHVADGAHWSLNHEDQTQFSTAAVTHEWFDDMFLMCNSTNWAANVYFCNFNLRISHFLSFYIDLLLLNQS